MTQIEWTDQTWNPIVGCSVTSPGCTNCYAMKMAHRLAGNPATPHYHGTTQMTRGGPVFTGKVSLAPEKTLTAPLRRRKPTTYFVNSMGDLFHENVPDEWIDKVFAVMALCPQHTFQVLTKRARRMREYMQRHDDQGHHPAYSYAVLMALTAQWNTPEMRSADFLPRPNVWLGVSAEDQARADERVPDLLVTPAAVRFVSAEPLLGPVDLTSFADPTTLENSFMDALRGKFWMRPEHVEWPTHIGQTHNGRTFVNLCASIDWVIVGGESGPGARPMHPDWARSMRDQCQKAGVAFFFKQWGEWLPYGASAGTPYVWKKFTHAVDFNGKLTDRGTNFPDGTLRMVACARVGKVCAGRTLDGRECNGMPT